MTAATVSDCAESARYVYFKLVGVVVVTAVLVAGALRASRFQSRTWRLWPKETGAGK